MPETPPGWQKRYSVTAPQRLIAKLPTALQDDPDVLALANLRSAHAVKVVHLIYRRKHYESQSKDYKFSRLSMQEHWDAGHTDMAHPARPALAQAKSQCNRRAGV